MYFQINCKKQSNENTQSANVFNLFYFLLRSSLLELFCKRGVLRIFAKFTGKHLYQSLFFNKVLEFGTGFPGNFAKFLRAPFLTEHFRWLFLYFQKVTESETLAKYQSYQKVTKIPVDNTWSDLLCGRDYLPENFVHVDW